MASKATPEEDEVRALIAGITEEVRQSSGWAARQAEVQLRQLTGQSKRSSARASAMIERALADFRLAPELFAAVAKRTLERDWLPPEEEPLIIDGAATVIEDDAAGADPGSVEMTTREERHE